MVIGSWLAKCALLSLLEVTFHLALQWRFVSNWSHDNLMSSKNIFIMKRSTVYHVNLSLLQQISFVQVYIAWTWNWSSTNLNFPCTVHPPLYEFEWSRDADINPQSKYLHLLNVFIFNVRSWEAFINWLPEFQGWVL